MTDDDFSQVEIPESFQALFVTGHARKPNATHAQIAARYELCEDVANGLQEPALARHRADHGIAPRDVLTECELGLSRAEAGLSLEEAVWAVRRLAELLGWPHLARQAQPASAVGEKRQW